jgi:membrane protein
MAVLKVLVGGAQLSGTALVTSSTIRRHTRIGYDELGRLLEQMVAEGWVGRVLDEAPTRIGWKRSRRGSDEQWVLLVDPGMLQLADVYRLFVFDCAAGQTFSRDEGAGPEGVLALDGAALARQVEAVIERGLDQTLAEHFGCPG